MKIKWCRTRVTNTFILILLSVVTYAQIPAGYYDDASGKTGYTLKTSLYNIIKDHNAQSYDGLWTVFQTSDVKSNGKVWDMYSDVPGGTPAYEYTFTSDQCGNYSGEGSCYNREHSFPKSWFNDAAPMYTDAFHIVPSDGYVNGKRGNLPYGEVGSASYTSTNGSKVGTCDYPGYTGQVFEPIDEYKGDFARGYFYMATRYENIIAGWENNNENGDIVLNGTSDQVFEDWVLQMLIAWHNADPVSQKETDRNNAIYNYQGNRNPFIDHPEYVGLIWGGDAVATINVTSSLTDFGTVDFGGTSVSQTYSVEGTNLSEDIVITSNNGFEISLTDVDANFTTSLNLSPTGGTVNETTIYVRFKPESNSNGLVNGVISHTSSGAESVMLNVSGTEATGLTDPVITVDESLTDFGTIAFGETSAAQTYSVEGTNLSEDITITSNSGFEISLTDADADFTTSLNLSPASGTVSSTTIFVRFKPASNSNGPVNGTIAHASSGASNVVLNLSGSETSDVVITPKINFSFSERTIDPISQYEVQLFSDVAPPVDLSVKIGLLGASNLVYGETYTTAPALSNGELLLNWASGETNASFFVDFQEDQLDLSNPGSLSFVVNEGDGYTLGTNTQFGLNLKAQDVVTGISEPVASEAKLYPNPGHGIIYINSKEKVFQFLIVDVTGQVVMFGETAGESPINVSNLRPGSYIFRLINSEKLSVQKLIIY